MSYAHAIMENPNTKARAT